MLLREIAHARSGDKGDVSNISVIVYDGNDFELLRAEVSVDRVRACLGNVALGAIVRYEMSTLGALNFVLDRALGGGVTRSLALDSHGKCLSSILLSMEIGERP